MGLLEAHWSPGLVKVAVELSGRVPFAEAEYLLAQLGQVTLADTSLWRRVQTWGTRGQQVEAAQRQAAVTAPVRPSEVTVSGPRLGVALDGVMVPLRAEGWKETKLGAVFEVAVRPTPDPVTGDLVDTGHAVRTTYVAHLGGPETLGELAWAEARRRGWLQAEDTQVLGDGAAWIWNQAETHFDDSRQLVDWYHAKEHLWAAARALYGEGTPAAQHWVQTQETPLFEGHAARIAERLRTLALTHPNSAEVLHREAGYFTEHQRRMQYLELREDGWPIGSGMVESGAKQLRARFAQPGMRWSRPGAEHMLPIRTAIMSHTFDAWWKNVTNLPPN